MSSIRYLTRHGRSYKIIKNRRYALQKNPQKKGSCIITYFTTPKKPNSAVRKVAKIGLSNRKRIMGHIHGIGQSLTRFASVLVRGCRVRDTPGIKYRFIHGKYDFKSVLRRNQARSKYGVKKKTY